MAFASQRSGRAARQNDWLVPPPALRRLHHAHAASSPCLALRWPPSLPRHAQLSLALPPHPPGLQAALDPKLIASRATAKWVREFRYFRASATGASYGMRGMQALT